MMIFLNVFSCVIIPIKHSTRTQTVSSHILENYSWFDSYTVFYVKTVINYRIDQTHEIFGHLTTNSLRCIQAAKTTEQ